MADTPNIQAPQAGVLVPLHFVTSGIDVSQAQALAPYNVPAKHLDATQAQIITPFVRVPTEIQATQAALLVVCDGRNATPYIRAFTFTLDGHDFYCLRLGDTETLVYDVSSQEWIDWASDPLLFWRVNCGINWVGAQSIGYSYGNTDVVLGDDTWGLLWFLAPTQQYDDYPDELAPDLVQQVPFNRIVMAQTTVSGRNFLPCYAAFLSGDNYGINSDFTPFVQLETSDDQGRSWINHGIINAQPDIQDQDYRWTSLGQMQSPGRLFKITDNGILTRIDSLEMNDD